VERILGICLRGFKNTKNELLNVYPGCSNKIWIAIEHRWRFTTAHSYCKSKLRRLGIRKICTVWVK
jgi:hypothetical protein